MKWNVSGFRPPLCTYRLNWARRTSWGWWDDLDDTVLQTQDSKFEPWRSEAEHATSRSRSPPHNTEFHTWMGKKQTGNRTPNSGVRGSGANHYPRAPAQGGPTNWVMQQSINRPKVQTWKWHVYTSKQKQLAQRLFNLWHSHWSTTEHKSDSLSCSIHPLLPIITMT